MMIFRVLRPIFLMTSINLSHLLHIPFLKLPLHPIIRHLTRHHRHPHLLEETKTAHRTLPIADVFGREFNQRHARIFGAAGVYAVAQVAEPGADGLAVELFDARIVVGFLGAGSGDGDPILRRGVLEGYLRGGVVGEVGEFLGVGVGEEEEVGAVAL